MGGKNGIAQDIFGRVAALKYRGCSIVQADVMMQIDGDGLVLDHTWQWHADHDDCGTKSNSCYSSSGLRVTGADVIAYGVQVEHQMGNLLDWHGEGGQLYFYQAELNYADNDINIVGYNVDYSLQQHTAYGLGVYIIQHNPSAVHAAIRVPPTALVKNMWDAVIGGSHSQFHHLVCTDAADQQCQTGSCSGNLCYLASIGGALMNSSSVVVV